MFSFPLGKANGPRKLYILVQFCEVISLLCSWRFWIVCCLFFFCFVLAQMLSCLKKAVSKTSVLSLMFLCVDLEILKAISEPNLCNLNSAEQSQCQSSQSQLSKAIAVPESLQFELGRANL